MGFTYSVGVSESSAEDAAQPQANAAAAAGSLRPGRTAFMPVNLSLNGPIKITMIVKQLFFFFFLNAATGVLNQADWRRWVLTVWDRPTH